MLWWIMVVGIVSRLVSLKLSKLMSVTLCLWFWSVCSVLIVWWLLLVKMVVGGLGRLSSLLMVCLVLCMLVWMSLGLGSMLVSLSVWW